jgi:imidazolonepropionase-like amidohydrolase
MGSIKIPKGAEQLDVTGKTIMPALINLHGHLGLTTNGSAPATGYTEANVRWGLDKYQSYGVETVASLGQDGDLIYGLRDAQHAGQLGGARLFTAGRGFAEASEHPNPADIRYRPSTPEEARAEVRELVEHRPDYIKMWVDNALGHGTKMRPAVYKAIIDEAHQHNVRVFAHEFYLDDAKSLLSAGIDGFAHSIRDQPVDRELIQAMKARNVFLIPTLVRDEVLFAYADGAEWLKDPFFQEGLAPGVLDLLRSSVFIENIRKDPDLPKYRAGLEMAKKNLKTLYDGGVKIAFGTDSGISNRFPGYFEHRELQLMVGAGLTPLQAITAATGTNAEILKGEKAFGTLQVGRQADFLVLDASPLDDIRNTEKLASVWKAGKRIPSVSAKALSANRN